MASKIAPISGFPEYLPAQQLAFNTLISKVRAVYESFGYVPLETPAVERIDTLVSKGIDSKEVYALRRLNAEGEDNGSKDLALKFDLTVPLARYVSQHYANLTFPFRRYQIQPVWRGERAQKGRERQFYQFDLDYIAENKLPLAADAEVIAAAHNALEQILPKGVKFIMRLNNRKLLQGLLNDAGYDVAKAIKVVDDLEKISEADALSRLAEITPKGEAKKLLTTLKGGDISKLKGEGAEELQTVFSTVQKLLGKNAAIKIDLTIARGLDYYTGTVIETNLVEAPKFGSICSGGRYDNLAESLSDRKLPGVGVSIGLTRLCEWLFERPEFQNLPASPADILVPCPEKGTPEDTAPLAAALRAEGLKVVQSLDPSPLGKQLQKADERGIKYAAIPETDGKATLRTFATRSDEKGLTPAQISDKIK